MKTLAAAALTAVALAGGATLSAAPAQAAPVVVGIHVGAGYDVAPVGYHVRRVHRVRHCTVTYQRFYNGYKWVVKPVRVCNYH